MSQPQVAIAITADDKTAKGWSSAEKRAGRTIGKIGATNKDGLKAAQDGITRSSRGIVKAFSAIEQAGSRALGGGSIIGQAGAIRNVGILARGMGAAAAEGIGLEGAAVGAAGAVAGVAAAAVVAGAAMWKLSDGWGKGANQLGNMASLIGVSTKGLQEFAGAAERVGVDKDTATGTLGSLSQTLNDARYGRNNAALAMLSKMGVKLQTNPDGTVNVEAMLPATATAIAAQNSSGRRTAAHALGISDAALAAFSQGGGALSADMRDYGENGAVMTDADTKMGRDLTRRDTIGAQRLGKAWLAAQRWNATAVKDVGDAVIGAANGDGPDLSGLNPIGSASAQEMPSNGPFTRMSDIDPRAEAFAPDRMADWRGNRKIRGAGRFTARQIGQFADRALPLVAEARRTGFQDADAIGVSANAIMEGGGRTNAREDGGRGPGRGMFQITDRARKALFRRITGVDIDNADRQTQWNFARWETNHSEQRGWQRAHASGDDPASVAAGYARYVERPANPGRDGAERAAVADAISIKLEFSGLPHGTGVTATGQSAHGSAPAISHAFNRH